MLQLNTLCRRHTTTITLDKRQNSFPLKRSREISIQKGKLERSDKVFLWIINLALITCEAAVDCNGRISSRTLYLSHLKVEWIKYVVCRLEL